MNTLTRAKAERDFFEAACEWGRWYSDNFRTMSEWSAEESKLVLTYRAMIEEEEGRNAVADSKSGLGKIRSEQSEQLMGTDNNAENNTNAIHGGGDVASPPVATAGGEPKRGVGGWSPMCYMHGKWNAATESACPTCLVELRAELAALKARVADVLSWIARSTFHKEAIPSLSAIQRILEGRDVS